jgi:hypothetical protein
VILAYLRNAIAEDRSKAKAPLRMRVVARPGESGRGLQGEGTRPPSTLVYVAPEAGASAERHILNTSDQCGFGMVASGIDLERPEPESSGLFVRRSGRDGGGEALTGLWTTESNTPAFKRC